MNKNLIIFSHHYIDGNILLKYKLLQLLNPNWDIISIGFKEHKDDLIPNSILVDSKNYPDNSEVTRARPGVATVNWTQADLFLYETYLKYPQYAKYFLIEYDTIFNCSIEEFFPNINIYNHFGTNVYNNLNPEWYFYRIYTEYNPEAIELSKLASIGQTTCIYLDNNLLSLATNEIISNQNKYHQMNSELRLGTIIKKFNQELFFARIDIKEYISWDSGNLEIDFKKNKYFYHPYK